ncbi:MAG: hypothetical protein HYR74_06550 [Candidatus Eisenbacteria bacterium]|nr:hypothetical protein [Candidatus Eisenbacteria bacterium]
MSRNTQRRPRERSRRVPRWLSSSAPRRIRAGRVQSAQARIAAGHYDRPDVRARLVDALIEAIDRT